MVLYRMGPPSATCKIGPFQLWQKEIKLVASYINDSQKLVIYLHLSNKLRCNMQYSHIACINANFARLNQVQANYLRKKRSTI